MSDVILNKIKAALKDISTDPITVDNLGQAKLNPEQESRFIRTIQKSTPMLEECRMYPMTAPEKNIDRTGFGQRVLKNPDEEDLTSKPDFAGNKLEVCKPKAVVSIKDDTLEDNIEKGNFENTLVEMIAERVGVDLEELFIRGDTDLTDGDDDWYDPYYLLTDGWFKLAEHQIGSGDYDANDPEAAFDALFKAVPRKMIRNRSAWRYWVHYDLEDDYREILRDRGTALGDRVMTDGGNLPYNGIPVVPTGNMPEGAAQLGHPGNNTYGIYRDIRIEPEREAKLEQTDFVVTLRVDAHFENEKGAASLQGYDGLSSNG